MSTVHSSVFREISIPIDGVSYSRRFEEEPEREYRVAPRRERRCQRRRLHIVPIILAGFFVFLCGFLLGKASAFTDSSPEHSPYIDSGGDGSTPVQALPVPATESGSSWNLTLVNCDHPLPEDFSVPDLTRLKNGHAIDSRAYPSLQAMMDAARAEGLQPLICSSFRTWDKQARLFENKVQRLRNEGRSDSEADREAAVWVARPGTSEHQLGLAVDIVDQSYQLLDEKQEDTDVQKWLIAHCAEYGFILRYPTDKSALTGIGYEPWHYRYVGTNAARAIMDGNLCLEEYLAS